MAANRLGVLRLRALCDAPWARSRAGGGRCAARLRGAADARRDRVDPRRRLSLRGPFRLEEIDESRLGSRSRCAARRCGSTSRAAAGARRANMVWTALLATIYYAVKTVVGPAILPNAGLYRPIHVAAPKGSILNCSAPAAVNSRTSTCAAGGRSDPRRARPGDSRPSHRRLQRGQHRRRLQRDRSAHRAILRLPGDIGGGFGARATKDGLDGVQVHVTNTSNLPVEAWRWSTR